MRTFILLNYMILCLYLQGQSDFSSKAVPATEKYAKDDFPDKKGQSVRILFYNAENFYDPYDDTLKMDDEFTPKGAKHWTYSKFRAKLNNLARVILAAGQPDPPGLVGLCEIENRYVLNRIIYDSPLKKFGYRIIHHESPDLRGVDVAFLYRPGIFRVTGWNSFRIRFEFDTASQTREILYIRGVLFGEDTIHLFINHWPSRMGDYTTSVRKRDFVASILKSKTDSVMRNNPGAMIVITGDFNDEPDNSSMLEILRTKTVNLRVKDDELFNLMYPMLNKQGCGTIKYQGRWSVFDQFIVSGALLSCTKGVFSRWEDAHIFQGMMVLEKDDRYLGYKPNRTFTGPRYHGGFSDHLPVYLDIHQSKVNTRSR